MAASPKRLTLSPATASSATASPEQRCNSLLSSFKDSDITAWLRLLRSIESCHWSRPGENHLSPIQLIALRWLSSIPQNQAEKWLAERRALTCQDEQPWNINNVFDTTPQPTLLRTGIGTSEGESIPSHEIASHEHIPRSDRSQSFSPDEASRHQSPSNGSRYWSTAKDKPQQFTTFDGFRRHENEREKYYIFAPDGVIEHSTQNLLCALCLVPDPDRKHFEMHNVLNFMEDSRPLIKRSRKENFRKLLRTYKVPEEHTDRLIKKWHCTRKKRAYSCGLCIKLFNTLLERTNHLAHEHYEKGENRDRWDINTLIRGLLLQPDIYEEFRKRYDMDPSTRISQLSWIPSSAQKLQERLESRRESPEILAQAAIESAIQPNASFMGGNIGHEADQIPDQTELSPFHSSRPPSLNDSVVSSNFQANFATDIERSTARSSDQINDFCQQWSKPKTHFGSSDVWHSFAGGIDPSVSVDTTIDLTGSLPTTSTQHEKFFEEQTVHKPHRRSISQEEATLDQEHAIYSPESFTVSRFIKEDVTAFSESFWNNEPWFQEAHPWNMPGHEETPYTTSQEPSMGHPAVKRKLSMEMAPIFPSKSLIMSPSEEYPTSNHNQPNFEQ